MLNQNLIITYSNQRVREIKANNKLSGPIDKVITLDDLISEYYETSSFKIPIDSLMGSAIIYKLINDYSIEYFEYLASGSKSLEIIHDFIIKCNRNEIDFEVLLNNKKLNAIKTINDKYQEFKLHNNLIDISDTEDYFLNNFSKDDFQNYKKIIIDDFVINELNFIKSKKQEKILAMFTFAEMLDAFSQTFGVPKLIEPNKKIFDTIDEVKTAIKITRQLMENGVLDDEILIVTTDINEYAPLYKLFLNEFKLKGFSSLGSKLNGYYGENNFEVQNALNNYKVEIEKLQSIFEDLGLDFCDNFKEKIKQNITIQDEKIGIELTEANQLLGTSKKYKHIIFMGTDINHFPPKAKDNFLCKYEDEVKYFYKHDFFLSSQIQYQVLKTLCDNLYILTASHSGKRELKPSIILDKKFDEIIDVRHVKSINELAYGKTTIQPNTEQDKEYYESIASTQFTKYDGLGVTEQNGSHLSASQINKYNSCPLSYLYSNKLKVQMPRQVEEGFDVMEQGSLMHLCFELFGKKIKENNIISVDAKELYNLMHEISIEAYNHKDTQKPRGKAELKENIHHQIFLSNLQAGLNDDREKGLLAKFVDYYIKNAKEFKYFKSSEFEKKFALDNELKPYQLKDDNDQGYFIKGVIDRFDILDEYINIVDYKSKKVSTVDKKKQEEIDNLKDVQLALYILYAKQQYPESPIYDSHLLSFKGNDKGIAFAALSNEDIYNDDYEAKLKQHIFDTKKNIENGNFAFNSSDEQTCEWCDMKFMCHGSLIHQKNEESKKCNTKIL